MELQRLRYFVMVAECLNFSTAARQMRLTVPTLSRQISKLEEELEVQLLSRNRRRVALTHAGELLLQEAHVLLSQAANIERTVRLAHKGEVGMVRIGLAPGLAPRISHVLVEHGRVFPAIDLQCGEVASDGQEEALLQRKIDIGFLRSPLDNPKLRSERVFEERLVVLIHQENPLLKRKPKAKSLRLKDLADEPLLLHERESSTALYDKILELYGKAGVSPKVVQQGPIIQYPILVAAGKGVAIGAEGVHSKYDSTVMAIPLSEPEGHIPVHMAWRKDEISASVLAFVSSARKVFPPDTEALPSSG